MFVTICKASGNTTFVYQTHYAQVFISNLGLNDVNEIISKYEEVAQPVH